MKQLVAIATFVLLFYGARGSPRIVGGIEAFPNEVPSIAALLRHKIGSADYEFHCAGTLIYPHIVLSAAQCFDAMYSQPTSWRVRVGSVSHDYGGVNVSVIGIRVHPEFDPVTLDNDVALINLGGPVDGIGVAPTPLPTTNDLPSSGGYANIAGWGATDAAAPPSSVSPILHVANVLISDRDTCVTNLYMVGFDVLDVHFCTTGSGAGICHNDVGSPLFHGGRLEGIASFHVGCGFDMYPAVYTAVAPYVYWIKENVLGH